MLIVSVAVLVIPVTTFPNAKPPLNSMIRCTAAPACTTVQVRLMPPPATITPPVRAVVPALVATLNVTVPLLVPGLPPVTASHDALVTAVQDTFAVTPMDRPLAAELDTTVGNTVSLAVKALRQDRIGRDLSSALRDDETSWLDADLG